MADHTASRSSRIEYKITLPVVLAFVACMLSIYLLGQHVYRYGSWRYAHPQPVLSETPDASDGGDGAVAVVVSRP